MDNLIYGIGINNKTVPASINKKLIKEYIIWTSMLRRCYNSNINKNSTYIGCTVSDNFKNYDYFYKWCHGQIGFNHNWELDKDILIRNNKIYHEDTCIFVPQFINLLFVKSNKTRGDYPIGVHLHKPGIYRAQCGTLDNKRKHLGLYTSVNEAFNAYKNYKENLIKQTAIQNKNIIDPRLYNAMLEYEVLITD